MTSSQLQAALFLLKLPFRAVGVSLTGSAAGRRRSLFTFLQF